MMDETRLTRMRVERRVARLLLLCALEDRAAQTRPDIEAELHQFSNQEIGEALASLEGEGVVNVVGHLYGASRCARHMDLLIA
jgi:hypothetical protein